MILFDRARGEVLQVGKPVRHLDPAPGNDVVLEYSDGRRELLTGAGRVATLPPR